MSTTTPLITRDDINNSREYQQYQASTSRPWLATLKSCCYWFLIVFFVTFIVIIVGVKIFVFKPIHNDTPSVDNSTAIEPNSKIHFYLQISRFENRIQSLIGLGPWIYSIPIPTHPKIQVAAVGLYVDNIEGKARLHRYKGKVIDDQSFGKIKEILFKTGLTQTMRFVLTGTPPTGRMLEWWQKNTSPILQKICPDSAEKEFETFSKFFPKPFKKGDDFSFERRAGKELYAYHGKEYDKAQKIGGSCMGRALFESQMDTQKDNIFNLLQDLFV